MPSDDERRELLAALQQVLGERAAAALMESLHPEPWDQLATKADISELRSDVSGLTADVSGLKTDVNGLTADVSGLKAGVVDLKVGLAEVRAEMFGLKGELAGIVPKLAIASLGTAATFYALMLAGVAVFD